MDLQKVEKPTARAGWLSRALGFFAEFRNSTAEFQGTFPQAPEVPQRCVDERLQLEGDGFGKLIGRRYEVDFTSPMSAEAIVSKIKLNMANLGPEELASFEKSKGVAWAMRLGDEYDINIFGPFNGQVRVIDTDTESFAFVTLQGHPEAGRIRFQLLPAGRKAFRFRITSWARSRDALIDLTYDKIPLAKSLQATMWRTFLERLVELSEGHMLGRIRISEAKLEAEAA